MKAVAPKPLPAWAEDVLASLPVLMSRAEAANRLSMSTRTLDRRIATGRLVAVRDEGKVMTPRRAAVDMLLSGVRT